MTVQSESIGLPARAATYLRALRSQRVFLTLCLLIMINQFGFGLITPVLPLYADSFGLGPSLVGVVIGVYGLARFVVNLPAGRLTEVYGRRSVLIGGTLVNALASALIATAQNLPQLLAYRVLAGAAAATVILTGQVMVGDLATPANRGRLMSIYQGFFLIGVGIGPAPGGFLADHYGLRTPFIAYAVFSVLASLVALFLIVETRPAAEPPAESPVGQPPPPIASLRSVVLTPAFLLISAVTFVQFFARTGVIFNVVPLLGDERIGLSPSQIGLTLTVVSVLNIAMLYHTGVFSDRYGRKPVIWPSTVLAGLSMIAYALSNSYAAFFASAMLWGVASGVSGPSPGAYIADLAPADLRGRVFGIYRTLADAGYVVGPLLLGWLLAVSGFTAPLLLTAAMFIVAGLSFALFAPETHRGERRLRHPRDR